MQYIIDKSEKRIKLYRLFIVELTETFDAEYWNWRDISLHFGKKAL